MDLETLATSTAQQLAAIWAELGVAADERGAFMVELGAKVEHTFAQAVRHEQARAAAAEAATAELDAQIRALQRAMCEVEDVVRRCRCSATQLCEATQQRCLLLSLFNSTARARQHQDAALRGAAGGEAPRRAAAVGLAPCRAQNARGRAAAAEVRPFFDALHETAA